MSMIFSLDLAESEAIKTAEALFRVFEGEICKLCTEVLSDFGTIKLAKLFLVLEVLTLFLIVFLFNFFTIYKA